MAEQDTTVVVAQPQQPATGFEPTSENVELLKNTLGDVTLQDNELQLFLYQAKRTGLDPLAKQIYVLKTGGRVSFMTSIDGLRLVAHRTGEYQGQTKPEWCGTDGRWKDVWIADTAPAASRVGVYRAGMREPVYGVATWKSYNQGKGAWNRLQDVMLAKCAEALALRKAFPHELSGLYTGDEIAEDDTNGQRTVSLSEAVKQAAKQLGDAGIESREDKIAIILGIAEVETINELTGQKMKVVLEAIKTEDINGLKTMYLSGGTGVLDGEISEPKPEARGIAKAVDEATAVGDTDLVELAAQQAAAKEPEPTWVVPEFEKSSTGIALPTQRKLIDKWLEALDSYTPGASETFVKDIIEKDTVGTYDEAMAVILELSVQLNDLEEATS